MRTFIFYIVQMVMYVYFRLGLYALWSKTYQFFGEQRYRNIKIATYRTFSELESAVDWVKWTGDTWRQGFDAISRAERIQWIINKGLAARKASEESGVDCDEFGHYITVALNKSLEAGTFTDELNSAYLFTVTWRDAEGKFGGHNVSLLVYDLEYSAAYSYMDYGLPMLLRDRIREVAQDVIDMYAPGGKLLCYAIHDHELNVVRVSRF